MRNIRSGIAVASVILGTVALGSACSPSRQLEMPLPSVSTTQYVPASTGAPRPPSEQAPRGMTLAAFNGLTNGMSYEDVISAVGAGTLYTEADYGDTIITLYSWNGTNSFSKAILSFTNNVLDSKTQYGLE